MGADMSATKVSGPLKVQSLLTMKVSGELFGSL